LLNFCYVNNLFIFGGKQMNPPNLFQKLAITGVAGAIGVIGLQAGVQAANFVNIPRGTFAPDKFAVFGDMNPEGIAPPCALCDSTVSSTAYYTLGDGDWTDDPEIVARGLGNPAQPGLLPDGDPIDLDAEWVFFYEVVNTDPLTDPGFDPNLEDFNVTKTDKNGDPVLKQPYTSGGYYEQLMFENVSMDVAPLDIPNNWEAEDIALGNAVPCDADEICIDPSALTLTSPNEPSISNNTVRGGAFYTGALFDFDINQNGEIPPDAKSSILFLTTDENRTSLVWAETESEGGDGAAGDVYGVKNVPEPGTILGLLAIGGLGLGMKRKEQK
jgi:hypothetical protein